MSIGQDRGRTVTVFSLAAKIWGLLCNGSNYSKTNIREGQNDEILTLAASRALVKYYAFKIEKISLNMTLNFNI